jgi:hypothetical protein
MQQLKKNDLVTFVLSGKIQGIYRFNGYDSFGQSKLHNGTRSKSIPTPLTHKTTPLEIASGYSIPAPI